MKNITIKTIITIFVISFFITYPLNGIEINLYEYNISINQEIDEQSVIENIIIMDNFNKSTNQLKFWITDDAKNILFLVNNRETTFENINNNEYILNISSTEIGNESIIKISISYSLDRNIKEFEKIKKHVDTFYEKYQSSLEILGDKKNTLSTLSLDLEKKEGEKKLISQEIKNLNEKLFQLDNFKKRI